MSVAMSLPVHVPVLLDEVIAPLQPRPRGRFIDCTVGLGGHAAAILEEISPTGKLLGIDADPEAIRISEDRLSKYGDAATLVNENFTNLETISRRYHIHPVDGILFDLAVSSLQLDTAERGFSFHLDAHLDMRCVDRVTFDGCSFTGHNASDNGTTAVISQQWDLGAVSVWESNQVTVTNCRFINNYAEQLFIHGSVAAFTQVRIENNRWERGTVLGARGMRSRARRRRLSRKPGRARCAREAGLARGEALGLDGLRAKLVELGLEPAEIATVPDPDYAIDRLVMNISVDRLDEFDTNVLG